MLAGGGVDGSEPEFEAEEPLDWPAATTGATAKSARIVKDLQALHFGFTGELHRREYNAAALFVVLRRTASGREMAYGLKELPLVIRL